LRILDSKDSRDHEILKHAPLLEDYLNESCKAHFEKIKELLSQMKIPYVVNPKLVRGLDYYNNTVFEVVSGDLGAHNTIGAGGRYDGLTPLLGGPDLPACGFATGLERLLQTMCAQKVAFPEASHPVIFFIPMGEAALKMCFEIVSTLRHNNIAADIDLSGKKIQQGLQLADSEKATYCMVVGERELQTGQAELKEMATRKTQVVNLGDLPKILGQSG
jgi:histidyl-tRNA synthetase